MIRNNKGFALVITILILVIMSILVPAMIWWSTQDSKSSVAKMHSDRALHLAEAAVDRGYWKLIESSENFTLTATQPLTNYNFDKVYTDMDTGLYTIKISSDPVSSNKRIIEGIGYVPSQGIVRKIKAVYINQTTSTHSIYANHSIYLGGAVRVHWGPVMAGVSIDTHNATYPRFYSGGSIDPYDMDPSPPNTDDLQWWSYYEVPPMTSIDLDYYKMEAQNAGSPPYTCGTSYYIEGNKSFKGCHDSSGNVYYVTGDVRFRAGAGGNFIVGDVIALGDITIQGSGGGVGSYDATIPSKAWEEYGADWSQYLTYDPTAPATYEEAVSSGYEAVSKTYHIDNVVIHGMLFVGGSMGLTGGGNAVVHGLIMSSNDSVESGSNFDLYFDDTISIQAQTSGTNLTQESWEEISNASWPSGL
jgi:hypothetical protein